MKTACKKPTLKRNASVVKLEIFTVRTRAASQRFQVKPMKGQLGLLRASQAKISDRSATRAPNSRGMAVAEREVGVSYARGTKSIVLSLPDTVTHF